MQISDKIRNKATNNSELTMLCRANCVSRNLTKIDGSIFVEYYFEDDSFIIKSF